jgi:hypothetical protein
MMRQPPIPLTDGKEKEQDESNIGQLLLDLADDGTEDGIITPTMNDISRTKWDTGMINAFPSPDDPSLRQGEAQSSPIGRPDWTGPETANLGMNWLSLDRSMWVMSLENLALTTTATQWSLRKPKWSIQKYRDNGDGLSDGEYIFGRHKIR